MQLSTRGRYAVMALAELASRAPEEPVSLAQVAACQQLSQCYLEQLFAKLRRAGLVASVRGPGGGYHLTRPAREVVIAAIIAAVEEPVQATRCHQGGPGCPGRMPFAAGATAGGGKCQTHDLWAELGQHIQLFLAEVTLEDVVMQRLAGRAAPAKAARPG